LQTGLGKEDTDRLVVHTGDEWELCDELSLMDVEIRTADLRDLLRLAFHNNCSSKTHTTSLDFDQDVVRSKLWKRDGDNAIFLWLRVPQGLHFLWKVRHLVWFLLFCSLELVLEVEKEAIGGLE